MSEECAKRKRDEGINPFLALENIRNEYGWKVKNNTVTVDHEGITKIPGSLKRGQAESAYNIINTLTTEKIFYKF